MRMQRVMWDMRQKNIRIVMMMMVMMLRIRRANIVIQTA